MTHRELAFEKISAGNGTALLTLSEWLAFNGFGDAKLCGFFLDDEARRLGISADDLIAAADRTTVAVEADIRGPSMAVRAYAYEIQDAPQHGITP